MISDGSGEGDKRPIITVPGQNVNGENAAKTVIPALQIASLRG
jgi:hypothetical protein